MSIKYQNIDEPAIRDIFSDLTDDGYKLSFSIGYLNIDNPKHLSKLTDIVHRHEQINSQRSGSIEIERFLRVSVYREYSSGIITFKEWSDISERLNVCVRLLCDEMSVSDYEDVLIRFDRKSIDIEIKLETTKLWLNRYLNLKKAFNGIYANKTKASSKSGWGRISIYGNDIFLLIFGESDVMMNDVKKSFDIDPHQFTTNADIKDLKRVVRLIPKFKFREVVK